MDKFKTKVFGGFNKNDVMNYIEGIVKRYEDKISVLKRELNVKERENEKLYKQLKQMFLQMQNFKKRIAKNEEDSNQAVEEKERQLKKAEALNNQLQFRIRVLEKRLLNQSYETRSSLYIQQVETAAREKADRIILQAKSQIEKEYNYRIKEAERKSKIILYEATEQAEIISDKAAVCARKLLEKSRSEAKYILKTAKQRADDEIRKAQRMSEVLLMNDVNSSILDYDDHKIKYGRNHNAVTLEQLQQNVEDEIKDAVRDLNDDFNFKKSEKEYDDSFNDLDLLDFGDYFKY